MKRTSLAIALALLAGGCASEPNDRIWQKDNPKPDELRQVSYECERDTRMSAGSFGRNPYMASGQASVFFEQCMNARDWYYSRIPYVPNQLRK